MESFGIASVAGITVICYLMGLIVKKSASKQQMDSQPGRAAGRDFGPGGMAVHAGLSRRGCAHGPGCGHCLRLAATGVHEAGCQLTREKP